MRPKCGQRGRVTRLGRWRSTVKVVLTLTRLSLSRIFCHAVVLHTMLAAVKVPNEFNADYYIAIITILPVLMIATNLLANFANSFPPVAEDKMATSVFFWMVSLMYLFTPISSASGIIAGVLALIFREKNGILQWFVFGFFVAVLSFMAIAASVYLHAWDRERQKTRERRPNKLSQLFYRLEGRGG
jgi:hypothetical protein